MDSLSFAVQTSDLESQFTLGSLYSMEQNGIPILSEMITSNRELSSLVCTTEVDEEFYVYKWPTLHFPSLHEPTWEKLCSVFQSNGREDLAKAVRSYLKGGRKSELKYLIG